MADEETRQEATANSEPGASKADGEPVADGTTAIPASGDTPAGPESSSAPEKAEASSSGEAEESAPAEGPSRSPEATEASKPFSSVEEPAEVFKKGMGLLMAAARGVAESVRKEVDTGGLGKVVEQAGRGIEAFAESAARGFEQLIKKAQPTEPTYSDWKTDTPSTPPDTQAAAGFKGEPDEAAQEPAGSEAAQEPAGSEAAQEPAGSEAAQEPAGSEAAQEPAGSEAAGEDKPPAGGPRIAIDDDRE